MYNLEIHLIWVWCPPEGDQEVKKHLTSSLQRKNRVRLNHDHKCVGTK